MTYSEEFKLRVVGELRASGLGYREASDRFPHFPSHTTLSRWDRELEAAGVEVELPAVRGRVERRKHEHAPEATRREALRLLSRGETARAVGRRLGVPTGTVTAWARKARAGATMPPKGAVAVKDADAARLERENAELLMENRALRELMRDPKSGGPASLSNRQKAELGERLRRAYGYSLREVTTFLRISRSSYEYAKAAAARPDPRAGLADRVERDFLASGRRYGYRRVHAQIAGGLDGEPALRVSEKVVLRLMRERGLRPLRTRAREGAWSSYGGEPDGRPANAPRERAAARRAADPSFRAAHDFSAGRPDELVVTDVTEFSLNGLKCYLSPVVDCFDGMPASWSVSRHPDSALADSSLEARASRLPEGRPPACEHSDGGAVYRSASWKAICAAYGVDRSMSRKACCPDNARAEGFFGALKEEFFNNRDWSGVGYDGFARALDAYLRWYRDGRLKAFRDGGRTVYETIAGRRRRLGYAV